MAMRRPSPPSWPAEPPDSSPSSIDPPFLFTWDTIRVFLGLGYQKRRRKERHEQLSWNRENVFLFIFSIREKIQFLRHVLTYSDGWWTTWLHAEWCTRPRACILDLFEFYRRIKFENAPVPVWYGLACGTQLQLQIEMWYWLLEPTTTLNAFL